MVAQSLSKGTTANKLPKDLINRVRKAGYDRTFISAAVLPDWWDDSCERDSALVSDLEIRFSRFLRVPLQTIQDPAAKLQSPVYANAQLRRVAKEGAPHPNAAIHAALSVARSALRSLRQPLPSVELPPTDASRWHEHLAASGTGLLEAATADLWRRGIPVLHVEVLPPPRFQALACIIDARPVVVIGHDIDLPARLLSHLLHEVGHIVAGDCAEDAPVVDESDETPDRSKMERNADRYAVVAALGESPPEPPGGAARTDFRRLARAASMTARGSGLDLGSLIWFWTTKTREFVTGMLALKAAYRHLGGARVIRSKLDEHVDVSAASDTDTQAIMSFCIVTTVVPTTGFGNQGANRERESFARAVFHWAAARGVNLVSLPAGFLRGRQAQSAIEVATRVLADALAAGIAVVLGVDLGDKPSAMKARQLGPHPFWLVAQGASGRARSFQQRSIRSTDRVPIDAEQLQAERTLVVGDTKLALIACGEAFNADIREALRDLGLAIVSAHTALRSRHPRTLAAMGRNGTPVVRSVHAANATNVLWREQESPPVEHEQLSCGVRAARFVL